MKRIYVNKTTYYVLSLSMMLFILCGYKPKKVDKDSEDLGLKTPLMGWVSWNNYRVNMNEKIIKYQADEMVNLNLKDVGYTFSDHEDQINVIE